MVLCNRFTTVSYMHNTRHDRHQNTDKEKNRTDGLEFQTFLKGAIVDDGPPQILLDYPAKNHTHVRLTPSALRR